MELSKAEILAVESSFALVAKSSAPVLKAFYSNLFEAHPATEGPFILKGSTPNAMMWASIGLLVQNAADLEGLKKSMNQLGARHSLVGAKPAQLSQFADILLGTIAEANGANWTDDHETGWEKLLGFAVEHMIGGMPQPQMGAVVIDTRRKSETQQAIPTPEPVEEDKDAVLRQIVRAAMGDAPVAAPSAHQHNARNVPGPATTVAADAPAPAPSSLFKRARPSFRREPPPPTPVDQIVIPPAPEPAPPPPAIASLPGSAEASENEQVPQPATLVPPPLHAPAADQTALHSGANDRPSAEAYRAKRAAMIAKTAQSRDKPGAEPAKTNPDPSHAADAPAPGPEISHLPKPAGRHDASSLGQEMPEPGAPQADAEGTLVTPASPGDSRDHAATARPSAADYRKQKALMTAMSREKVETPPSATLCETDQPEARPEAASPTQQATPPIDPSESARQPGARADAAQKPAMTDEQQSGGNTGRDTICSDQTQTHVPSPAADTAALIDTDQGIEPARDRAKTQAKTAARPSAAEYAQQRAAMTARASSGPECRAKPCSNTNTPPTSAEKMPPPDAIGPEQAKPAPAPATGPPVSAQPKARPPRPSAEDYETMRSALRQQVGSTPPAQSD